MIRIRALETISAVPAETESDGVRAVRSSAQ